MSALLTAAPPLVDQRRIGVPAEMLVALEKEVAKLARRAKRLGLEPPTLTLVKREPWVQDQVVVNPGTSEEYTRTIWVPSSEASQEITLDTPARMVSVIDISIREIRLEGWRLGAYIEHSADNKVQSLHTFNGFESLGEKFGEADAVCAHCQTKRERKRTYIVQHEDGRVEQVGSGCLHDFIGGGTADISVNQWVNYWTNWDTVGRDFIRSLWTADAKFMPRVYALRAVMATTVAFIRQNGWVSRQQASQDRHLIATADMVKEYGIRQDPEYREQVLPGGITPEDYREADRSLAMCRDRLISAPGATGQQRLSDYEVNLQTVVRHDYIADTQFGIAVSLIPYIRRTIEREHKQAKIQAETPPSEWFGLPGERETMELTLLGIRPIEVEAPSSRYSHLDYQTLYVHTFREPRGEAVWITAKSLPEKLIGKSFQAKATIKGHKEFRGIKQTNLSRVALTAPELLQESADEIAETSVSIGL